MTKISVYEIDDNVTSSDKWIGSDGNNQNRTKNFTPKKIAKYYNQDEVIDIVNSIRYKYDTIDVSDVRKQGTISFETEIGPVVPINSITTFLLSKTTQGQKTVSEFIISLPTTRIILQKSDNVNTFGIFKVLSVEVYLDEPDYFLVTLEFISGNGSMEEDLDYIISIIDLGSEDGNQNLQQVTDEGNVTTLSITADSFIKDGGTSDEFLMADGSVTTAIIPTIPTLQEVTTEGAITNVPTIFSTTDPDYDGIISIKGESDNGTAILGISLTGTGVYGSSTDGTAIFGGSINSQGVYGISINDIGVFGGSINSQGVYGSSINDIGVYGISAIGTAGKFVISLANTSNIVEFLKNNVNQAYVTHDGTIVSNKLLVNTTSDNGVDELQVNGSGFFENAVSIREGALYLYDDFSGSYTSLYSGDQGFGVTRSNGGASFGITEVDGFFANRSITGTSIKKTGGTSNQYLMADGSVTTGPSLAGYVPTSRTISTTFPLQGGGDLTANRTLSILQSTSIQDGYLSSTDWNTFNAKQPALSGTGFVKISGTTISYDNSTYVTTNTTQTITGIKVFNDFRLQLAAAGTSQPTVFQNSSGISTGSGGYNTIGFNSNSDLFFNDGGVNSAILSFSNTTTRTYILPDTSGTLALTSQIPTVSGTTNYVPKFTGVSALGNSSIFDNGNVGIGTTSPVNKLDIYDTNSSSTANSLRTYGTNTGAKWSGRIVAGGTNVAFLIGEYNAMAWLGAHNAALNSWSDLYINPDGSKKLFLGGNGGFGGGQIVTIDNASGNVGIRTTTPNATLDVNGTTITNKLLVNTTVDNGVDRLQVNGDSRVQGAFTATNDSTINGVNIGIGGGSISSNTRVGLNALLSNTTGSNNTANGASALLSNTTGSSNTANGLNALRLNTTGGNNTAFGHQSLQNLTTGNFNTAFGAAALLGTTASSNTAVGYQAMTSNATGTINSAFGREAGRYIADKTTTALASSNSLFLGYRTSPLADSQTNQIVIGYDATGLGSNTAVLGNSSTITTAIYGNLLLGTTTNVVSSKLTIESTTQGFLPPRMTNAQRIAIVSPAVGLMVYCTNAVEGVYVNKSTGWTYIG